MEREKLRLILLDDESIILEGLKKTYDWNRMGYEVAGAYLKAEDALKELEAVQPQVILSDIKMKNMDGLEFMRRVKQIFPDCIGILISAYKDFDYAKQACEMGVFHYLLKPFTEEMLADVMQKAYCSYMENRNHQNEYELLKRAVMEDDGSLLSMNVQRFIKGSLSGTDLEKIEAMKGNGEEKQNETENGFAKTEQEAEEAVPGLLLEKMKSGVIEAVRKNDLDELKEAYKNFIYALPKGVRAKMYIHQMGLEIVFYLDGNYGISQQVLHSFQTFFKILYSIPDTRAVDYLYKLLQESIMERKQKSFEQTGGSMNGYIRQALEYMESNYWKEDLSISMVAEEIGLSQVYLGRLFIKSTGISFRRHLIHIRMEKAQRLLRERKCSIVEAGMAVGIGNPSYFTQLFKQYTGKLPSEFI